tara:strand:- start:1830 stop:2099 length:270 start_codon:yes stop_codon:yes gene_type:complete
VPSETVAERTTESTIESAITTECAMESSPDSLRAAKRQNTRNFESLAPPDVGDGVDDVEGPLSLFVRRRSGRDKKKKKEVDSAMAMDEG